jgi:hypothetical protein
MRIIAVTLTMFGALHAATAIAQTSASTGATKTEALPEVTVTAQHLQLEQRVSKFVNQIAALENGEGLPRWQQPVCPLVSGLPQQEGESILGQLSAVARTAGVPLAGERCNPNLYILVTREPERLLRAMEKRNRAFTFGYDRSSYPPTLTPASIVDEFIKTPRAVRVWYGSSEMDAWGKPLSYCQAPSVLPKCTESGYSDRAACDPGRYYRCGTAVAGGSHLVFSTVWTFSRVFVIVDQNRIAGVTVSQLADYAAMSGFTKINPDARLGDAPTILTLFSGLPEAAPGALTEWDQAFLKSVYATEPRSRQQRNDIVHTVVSEIAH